MEINVDNLPDVKGLTVEEAKEALASHGINAVRVSVRNGVPQIGTMDMRSDRLNVSTQDGFIISAGKLG